MAPINGPWTSARCELLPEGYIWEHTSLNSKTHLTLKPYYKSEYYNHHFPKRRGGSWETANKKRRENLKSPSGLFRPMPCLSPHLNQTLSSSNHQSWLVETSPSVYDLLRRRYAFDTRLHRIHSFFLHLTLLRLPASTSSTRYQVRRSQFAAYNSVGLITRAAKAEVCLFLPTAGRRKPRAHYEGGCVGVRARILHI